MTPVRQQLSRLLGLGKCIPFTYDVLNKTELMILIKVKNGFLFQRCVFKNIKVHYIIIESFLTGVSLL